jgi:hypothetical protein
MTDRDQYNWLTIVIMGWCSLSFWLFKMFLLLLWIVFWPWLHVEWCMWYSSWCCIVEDSWKKVEHRRFTKKVEHGKFMKITWKFWSTWHWSTSHLLQYVLWTAYVQHSISSIIYHTGKGTKNTEQLTESPASFLLLNCNDYQCSSPILLLSKNLRQQEGYDNSTHRPENTTTTVVHDIQKTKKNNTRHPQ